MNLTTMKKIKALNKITSFDVILAIFLGFLAIITAFPFYYMIIISFATFKEVQAHTLYVFPTVFDWSAYKIVLENKLFWNSVGVTCFVTIMGTALGVFCSVCAAYPLSKKDLPGNKFFFNMMIFTMFFGGGMIPGYLVVQQLGLGDNVWCMILPTLVGSFNIILLKNYIQDLPASIEESARIDGANDMVILFKIVLPMSLPIIATIALFISVDKWNEYWFAMLHIIEKSKYPLQLVLRGVLRNTTDTLTGTAAAIASQETPVYAQSLQMAIVTVATLPILLVYPFVQKYFTKGIILGGVKG